MPSRDIYHNTVKNALLKDGWTITHDPLRLEWGKWSDGTQPGLQMLLI